MKLSEISLLAQEIAPVMRGFVEQSFAPLATRLAELEAKMLALPPPRDGKDADPDAVAAIVAERFEGDLRELKEAVAGLAADPPDIAGMVERAVALAVAALPAPKDGQGVTVADITPMVEECVAKAVAAIPMPKDGVGLCGMVIDRDGALVATMSDGSLKELGPVVGRDADQAALERLATDLVAKAAAAIPVPRDGVDGLGFDDLSLRFDGERKFVLVFQRGETVKEFPITVPGLVDQGVYKSGSDYLPGDGVTWGGNFWIARRETSAAPGDGDDWRLAVRKGRDAKMPEVKPRSGPIRVGVPEGESQ